MTAIADTPRTPDQVRFDPNVVWEEQEAMYRQSVADGGLTLSYGERAKEIVNCARTALPPDEYRDAQLEKIGLLLVIWEGTIMLYEDMIAERDAVIEARGELLDFAQVKIAALQPEPPRG